MPTYVYKFYDGATVELEQSIHDEPCSFLIHPEKCIPCTVTRVPQSPSIKLKGKGFFRTGG